MVKTPTPAARALAAFEARFVKNFGAGTLETSATINPYEVISTGSLTIDYKLGVGGFVEGRLVEIWGPESVGKTTLGLLHLAEAQRKHVSRMVAIVDVENKIDKAWAVAHGIDLTRCYLYHPKVAEDVADAVKEFVKSGVVSSIMVDSIGAMIPKVEMEKDAGDAVVGRQANIVTRMVKMAAVEAAEQGTVVVLINQQRANIGYGADVTSGGGYALKHATTMKLRARRTGTPPLKVKIGGEDRVVGHEISVDIQRNGVAPAYRSAILTLIHVPTAKYGPIGVDRADEAVTLGLVVGAIKQRGAWYDTPDGRSYNGKDALKDIVRGDLTLQDQIRNQVLASVADEIIEDEIKPEDIPEEVIPEPSEDTTVKPNFRTAGKIKAES